MLFRKDGLIFPIFSLSSSSS